MTRTAIKERPILFSGPMVRAILDGSKTQTRRVVAFDQTCNPPRQCSCDCIGWVQSETQPDFWSQKYQGLDGHIGLKNWFHRCPYGKPGDRLWVRETALYWTYPDGEVGGSIPVLYQDDDDYHGANKDIASGPPQGWAGGWWKKRPSIHMPRWASRILLEVTDVRVERVQDIGEADAIAEGIEDPQVAAKSLGWAVSAKQSFRILWDSINANRGYSWESNPWVWAVTFRRIEDTDETH